VLIQSRASLISAGTERSLVEFGKANLLSKARQKPERVKQVLDKIKSDGLLPTLEAVFAKLDEPLPLGYCNAGVVVQLGPETEHFAVGDRVVSNGPHAELVSVPVNLCGKVPDNVADEAAPFAVLGAIALQGIRLVAPSLGESVAVFGLGLVGQLAVQLLVASGARVLGLDLEPARLALAEEFGATTVDVRGGADPVRAAESFSDGHGVDGVLITASATNDEIVNQSARMARKRGRIVLVGVTDLRLDRRPFYEKELSFQVSCSYGPGRYDSNYEQQGMDYPYAYVRWTEQRNIQAVLHMMSDGRLDVDRLITHRVEHENAAAAYQLLASDKTQLGILLRYPGAPARRDRVVVGPDIRSLAHTKGTDQVVAGIIGAGSFTKGVLLPALGKTAARLQSIASAGGVSATHLARKFGIASSSTDYRAILDDTYINTVFITTRHHLHAPMVAEALAAGKHVFVEKPLAIDRQGLAQVRDAFASAKNQHLMVGFNRRFAPHAAKIKQLLASRTQPASITMTINAGYLPADHWAHDPKVGGGRIIGEACHWIDLAGFLVGSSVSSVQASCMGAASGLATQNDHVTIALRFRDGSIASINYFANGHRAYPKEVLTIFCEGKVLTLENFRVLRGYGTGPFRRMRLLRQDKGHREELREFVHTVAAGGPPLIAPDDLWRVTEVTIEAQQAIAGWPHDTPPVHGAGDERRHEE
jgi:predicted dehydrogenase/threonine dehydrogenase-like Zn-dependent dehydrogenase